MNEETDVNEKLPSTESFGMSILEAVPEKADVELRERDTEAQEGEEFA